MIATLLLLRILHATIPVGVVYKLALLVGLHIEFGIARIHACLDTVVHYLILLVHLPVLMSKLTHAAEGQEGAQAQGSGRMGFKQSVTDEDTVLVMHESLLFLEDYATDAVDGGRHTLPLKLSDVLMSLRTEVCTRILVNAKVEFGAVLNHRLVEGRE